MKIGFIVIVSVLVLSYPALADHPDDIYWEQGPGIPGIDGPVSALVEFDGRLIAGGEFNIAGDTIAHNIAAWNGTCWSPIGSGFEGSPGTEVHSLTIYDGRLIVGGRFNAVDGVPAENIVALFDSAYEFGFYD